MKKSLIIGLLMGMGLLGVMAVNLTENPMVEVGHFQDVVTKLTPVVDVRAYGAVPDDGADDTLALQAVATAVAAGNCVVVFPPGVYKMSWQGTDFQISQGGDDGSTSQTSYLYWMDANNITIRGYGARIEATLDVTDEGSLNMISFYGCDNVTVEGLDLSIEVTGTAEALEGHRATPIRFQHNGSGRGCKNVTVQNNRIHVKYVGDETGAKNNMGGSNNTYGKCIGIVAYGNARPGEPNEAWMENVKILNNWFEDCTARVLWTWYAKNLLVDGNRFENSFSNRPSVRIIQPHHNVQVTNNYFWEDPTSITNNYYAVTLSSDDKDTPGSCSKALISGNIYELAISGAHYVTGWTDVTISNEQFVQQTGITGTPVATVSSMVYDATEEPNATGYVLDGITIRGGGSISSTVPRTMVANCVITDHEQSAPRVGAIDLTGNASGSMVRNCQIVAPENYGVYVSGPNEVTVQGCDINDVAQVGIYFGAGANRGAAIGNTIRGSGSTGVYLINSENATVVGNEFEHCVSYGVRVYTGATGAVVRSNRFSDCGTNIATLADTISQFNYPEHLNTFGAGLAVKNGATSAGYIDLYEKSDVDATAYVRESIAIVDLSNAQIKDLADTPVQLIAAPGSGKWLELCGASLWLDYGTNALTEADSPDDLCIEYDSGTGPAASASIVASGFITATADTGAFAIPVGVSGTAAASIVNKNLALVNTGADYTGNAGNDTVLRVIVRYRVHSGLGL